MKLRSIVLALCVAACGQAGEQKGPETPEGVDPQTLSIEIGRYGVMLGQVDEHTRERPGTGEIDPAQPRAMARALRESAWEYNRVRSELCAKGLYTELACGPAYEPVWIAEPADADVSLEDLQVRAAALGAEVTPLWNAVCEDAAAGVQDEQERMLVCPME